MRLISISFSEFAPIAHLFDFNQFLSIPRRSTCRSSPSRYAASSSGVMGAAAGPDALIRNRANRPSLRRRTTMHAPLSSQKTILADLAAAGNEDDVVLSLCDRDAQKRLRQSGERRNSASSVNGRSNERRPARLEVDDHDEPPAACIMPMARSSGDSEVNSRSVPFGSFRRTSHAERFEQRCGRTIGTGFFGIVEMREGLEA